MDREIPRDLPMSYLRAIQKVPGDTAGEKLRWIGRLALKYETIEEDLKQLPPELLPILRVEVALKNMNKYEDITSALKDEDLTIINRAFKASWFFNGSVKEIVDVTYFCERLFPYVSVNTRTRIIITLGYQLFGKDPVFAQQIFAAVISSYGIETAYPLLMACDDDFVCKTIEKERFLLPVDFVKKMFRKNPDLVVSFLKLLKSKYGSSRDPFAIGIDKYAFILPRLIKRRIDAFVELYETHEPSITLSNTCAEIFLKKAKQYLIKKSHIYIRILPLKKINERLMETIFPNLFPPITTSFLVTTMLDYLKYYPHDKKYELLRTTYENVYNSYFNVTYHKSADLLEILPAEERIKQARKIANMNSPSNMKYYDTFWIRYLSVNEAIPIIKATINKTVEEEQRLSLIVDMIRTCKINKDDNALCETLIYFLNRCRNESRYLFEEIFEQLLEIYDVSHLNERQVFIIMQIVRMFYIKNNIVPTQILVAMVHFKLMHYMEIEDELEMLLKDENYTDFNILTKNPQYEKQCLITFANLIQKEPLKDFKQNRHRFCQFVKAMYDFNDRCQKLHIEIEKMTIKDYPWLINVVLEVITLEEYSWLQHILQLNEPELYCSWFPEWVPSLNKVTSGAALSLVKRDLQSILDNWKRYLEDCKKNYCCKRAQRFIRAICWYKDLPVKFAESCMDCVHEKREILPSLVVLTILLHDDTVTKLIDPFMPTKTVIDTQSTELDKVKTDYEIVQNLALSMRLSNPPVPLDLVVRLCVGDYLPIALKTLINVSRRTYLPEVISTAEKLVSMRVSVRKHGIRLMHLLTSKHELFDFYQKMWATERHYSIRELLIRSVRQMFLTELNPETWSIYSQIISTMTIDDEELLSQVKLFRNIPNEYVMKCLDLWLKTIDHFQELGLKDWKVNKYTIKYLYTLTESDTFELLPEEFVENTLRRFLFHADIDIFRQIIDFTLLYVLDYDKHEAHSKVFIDLLREIPFDNFVNKVTKCTTVDQRTQHMFSENFNLISGRVRLFTDKFVIAYVKKCSQSSKFNSQVIDYMMSVMFPSDLSPARDARSYLLFWYAKNATLLEYENFSFGLRIGQQLPDLVNIFSSLLIPFMAEVLDYLLCKINRCANIRYNALDEGLQLGVIEGLIEAENTYACYMAAIILSLSINQTDKQLLRYHDLIEKFRKMEDPAIRTVVCNHLYERFGSIC